MIRIKLFCFYIRISFSEKGIELSCFQWGKTFKFKNVGSFDIDQKNLQGPIVFLFQLVSVCMAPKSCYDGLHCSNALLFSLHVNLYPPLSNLIALQIFLCLMPPISSVMMMSCCVN